MAGATPPPSTTCNRSLPACPRPKDSTWKLSGPGCCSGPLGRPSAANPIFKHRGHRPGAGHSVVCLRLRRAGHARHAAGPQRLSWWAWPLSAPCSVRFTGIALALAFTLMGVTLDYPVHVFAHIVPGADTAGVEHRDVAVTAPWGAGPPSSATAPWPWQTPGAGATRGAVGRSPRDRGPVRALSPAGPDTGRVSIADPALVGALAVAPAGSAALGAQPGAGRGARPAGRNPDPQPRALGRRSGAPEHYPSSRTGT